MKKNIIFGGLLLFLVFFGAQLSQQKPLWNDELYSQNYVVEQLSVVQILKGEIPEGNNSPLFYLVQKVFCRTLRFQLPFEWKGEWNVIEPESQFILRFIPNVFMSLSIVLIFYYFSRFYSWGLGVYSLVLSLSSVMVWAYWGEARPYALWFFLTTVQCLLYLTLVRYLGKKDGAWRGLTVTHLFLSLTSAFGVLQITIVSFLLWLSGYRVIRKYFFSFLLPVAIGLFYYAVSPKYNFFVREDFMSLIYFNIPVERVGVVLLYGLFLAGFCRDGKRTNGVLPKEDIKAGVMFFFLTVVLVVISVALIVFLKMKNISHKETFDATCRYFLYLTPVGIIAMTLLSEQIVKISKRSPWVLMNVVIVLGGLLVVRFLRFYVELTGLGIY